MCEQLVNQDGEPIPLTLQFQHLGLEVLPLLGVLFILDIEFLDPPILIQQYDGRYEMTLVGVDTECLQVLVAVALKYLLDSFKELLLLRHLDLYGPLTEQTVTDPSNERPIRGLPLPERIRQLPQRTEVQLLHPFRNIEVDNLLIKFLEETLLPLSGINEFTKHLLVILVILFLIDLVR